MTYKVKQKSLQSFKEEIWSRGSGKEWDGARQKVASDGARFLSLVSLRGQISTLILHFIFLNFSKENISCLLTCYSLLIQSNSKCIPM